MIEIQYDGKWPTLCLGKLIVSIDGKQYPFKGGSLRSGGSCRIGKSIVQGKWTINDWPKDFPENYKKQTLSKINKEIQLGCCGGCR